jgi:hypothetical protein
MSCHSVGSGMTAQMQRAMQSGTPAGTAAHNDAVIRVYDSAGNVIETHEHAGDFTVVSAPKDGLAASLCFNANCLYAAGNVES